MAADVKHEETGAMALTLTLLEEKSSPFASNDDCAADVEEEDNAAGGAFLLRGGRFFLFLNFLPFLLLKNFSSSMACHTFWSFRHVNLGKINVRIFSMLSMPYCSTACLGSQT